MMRGRPLTVLGLVIVQLSAWGVAGCGGGSAASRFVVSAAGNQVSGKSTAGRSNGY
jgi:hypothetical protein